MFAAEGGECGGDFGCKWQAASAAERGDSRHVASSAATARQTTHQHPHHCTEAAATGDYVTGRVRGHADVTGLKVSYAVTSDLITGLTTVATAKTCCRKLMTHDRQKSTNKSFLINRVHDKTLNIYTVVCSLQVFYAHIWQSANHVAALNLLAEKELEQSVDKNLQCQQS